MIGMRRCLECGCKVRYVQMSPDVVLECQECGLKVVIISYFCAMISTELSRNSSGDEKRRQGAGHGPHLSKVPVFCPSGVGRKERKGEETDPGNNHEG